MFYGIWIGLHAQAWYTCVSLAPYAYADFCMRVPRMFLK